MKKNKTISTAIALIITFVVVLLLALSMNKIQFGDNKLLSLFFWVIIIRGIIVGTVIQNINYTTGLTYPSFISYIPYIQTLVIPDSKWKKICYFVFPVLALLTYIIGLYSPLADTITFANVEGYFDTVLYIAVAMIAVWRIMSGMLYGKLLSAVCDILDEKASSPAGPLFTIIKYLGVVAAYIPLLSLLTYMTLLTQSYVLRGFKEKELVTRSTVSRGGAV